MERTLKKGKKAEAAAPEVKKEKRVVNDTNRHKPFGKTAWAPPPPQILDDEVEADYYVAVPEMLQKLTPLKNKLRKKFPKSKRGSIGINIPKMLSLFRTGHEYGVESECYVRTQVATLDFPTQHILANLEIILTDVRSHRPADMGPLIERAILSSRTSEALWFNSESVLPQTAEDNQQQ
ncbi:large ribosomal subunit protein uL1m [Hippocampus comes]|uniref:large ribosomal subunit protein uL1m n=1 Tax=Hippocampus comes TaxID=109280 RepID=UPI00094F03AD|nr:PREDICTED: 39S ribosomal protein L1, mitochondrial-like [Hippocampus comes]